MLMLALPALQGCNLVPGQVSLSAVQSQIKAAAEPDAKFKEIDIQVSNSGANTARGISIRDSLPTGFTYASTIEIASSDAIRTRTVDPAIGTPSPAWGAWSLPPAVTRNKPTTLTLRFLAAVGRAPSKRANFVEVTSNDTDPVAAKPMALDVTATPVLDLAVATRSPIQAGGQSQYTITIRNSGTAAALTVFISASLAPGFIYAGTNAVSGNSLRDRVGVTDPFPDSLLPSWGTWTIPPQQFDGSAGVLRISFTARVAGDEPPGVYPISVTVTHDGLSAQTVADQAPVTVLRAG
jgi:uncharacterized repeat protein (TIGR01451 family)